MVELLKRYWMVLVAGALAAWAAFALINPALHLERTYERQANADTAYYAEKAQRQYAWDCVRLTARAHDKCRYTNAEPAREGQHDAQDLKAQLITSLWTRQMGYAAIIAMAVGIVGVILVWTTFRESREANVIARENASPIINLEMHLSFSGQPRGDNPVQTVLVDITNPGQGWAREFRLTCVLEIEGVMPATPMPVSYGDPVRNVGPGANFNMTFGDLALTDAELLDCAGKPAAAQFEFSYLDPSGTKVTQARTYCATLTGHADAKYRHVKGALRWAG